MKRTVNKTEQIKAIINSSPDGTLFIASDFKHVENSAAIHVYLNRLIDQNILIRYSRGMYQKPKFNANLNTFINPSLIEAAETIARSNNWIIVPTEEIALNSLGLSTQVSNQLVFASSGPNKKYMLNNRKIIFKHTYRTNELMTKHKKVAIAFQAFRSLGKDSINEINISNFLHRFNPNELLELIDLASKSTRWISEFIHKLNINNYETI